MFFLNFGLAQFLMLAGAASLATVALYLLDRSRRRLSVSTLRFWTPARQPVQTSRRRHIQQPWSLALQLLGILLLLLAIAQPRLGNPFAQPGYHVLVLETSAWMAARNGDATLMDTARRRAHRWLAAIPPRDRVMLVRADALATPATPFESDHRRIAAAIDASTPGSTSLDIAGALAFAHRAQAFQSGRGEITFIGAGRIPDRKDIDSRQPDSVTAAGLRVILIPDPVENVGLRHISVKRSEVDPAQWDALVALRNYGARPHLVTLAVGFDHAPIGLRRILLAPGAQQDAAFTWQSRRTGLFEAQLSPGDAFPDDDRASLVVPALPALPVVVYSTRPDVLRPFLAANSLVTAEFRSPAQYRPDDRGLVILDRFRPAARPQADTIWIDPSPGDSPVPVVRAIQNPRGLRWITGNPLGAGLRAHDARLASALIFQPAEGDIRVAEVDAGPILLARPGPRKMVVFGFDPGLPGMRFELSTPLAFANILRWIDPETFRQADLSVEAAGAVTAPLDPDALPAQLQVTREDGAVVPFTVDHGSLHFFSGARESVRVTGPARTSMYSLALPEMWDVKWQPPAGVLRGLPAARPFTSAAPEIWPWLAVAGAACLIAEWLLFARARRARLRSVPERASLRRAS